MWAETRGLRLPAHGFHFVRPLKPSYKPYDMYYTIKHIISTGDFFC